MKTTNLFLAFITALLLATFMGCTTTSTTTNTTPAKESTGEYIDDTAITVKVKTALLKEASLKSFQINVETYKGVVQLSGFVGTQNDIDMAVKVAKGVKGVVEVKNDMRLR